MEICDRAAEAIVTGIRLIGSCFDSDIVSVALIGGVANSVYIRNTINEILNIKSNKRYILVEPALPAVFGAVTMAMELKGIVLNEQILSNLLKGAGAIS